MHDVSFKFMFKFHAIVTNGRQSPELNSKKANHLEIECDARIENTWKRSNNFVFKNC